MVAHGLSGVRLITGDTIARRANEMYVSLTRFLTSSYAQALGIQRIAYNTGSAASGENYWDQNGASGANAWSAYTFLSATNPFQMLIQVCFAAATFGNSPGNPGLLDGATAQAGSIGVAFGARLDGSSSWGGTTLNNGKDVKGNVVWASGSSTLFVWPRSNTGGGTHAANKQNMSLISNGGGADPAYGSRLNLVCDENNIAFIIDANDYLPRVTYFGRYNVRSGTIGQVPHVMLRTATNGDPPLTFLPSVFGSTAGNATLEGACAHPVPPSGSQTTMICGVTALNNAFSVNYQPNNAISGTYRYDEHPIHLALAEATYYGYVGYTDWIRFIWGVSQMSVSNDGSRLYTGGQLSPLTTRISLPWSSSVGAPGAGSGREGTFF